MAGSPTDLPRVRAALRWVVRATLLAAVVNVVIHVALLGSGAFTGGVAWVMLFGSLLCLLCIPQLIADPGRRSAWFALGGMNAVMVVAHVVAASGGGHADHVATSGAGVGWAMSVSVGLSVLEAAGSVLATAPVRRPLVAAGEPVVVSPTREPAG